MLKVAVAVGLAVLTYVAPNVRAQSVIPAGSRVPVRVTETNPGLGAAELNTSMFVGITLTKVQIDSIVTLSHVIGKARRERLAQIPSYVAERSQGTRGWDSTTREVMAEFVEQERLAYRAVLDSEQQERYDRNTAMIMQLWAEGNRRRDAKRQAAAVAASQAQ